ncbi:MAG: cohesin domain-containing protein [Patescibacteria group bacterium]|nr:cohesin domain-containing protein [Patescibacteria group bacterium]
MKILVFFSFIFVIFSVSSAAAEAASLYFSPASGSYAAGKNFSVSVYVSSQDQAMNAASGVISFPADKLEIVSLSKSGSIFSLWIKEPAYANAQGTINFEGIVLNPGFSGKSGKILTITFKAKTIGTASLSFSASQVLANDGNGTSILSGAGRANYSISAAVPQPPVITPAPAAGIPPSPIITSLTHPAPLPWYSDNNPRFTWLITPDITADRISNDKSPDSRPKTIYSPPLAEIKFSDLEDGVWYLHVQLRNEAGWGDIAHFPFQIDTKPPEQFSLSFIDGKETGDPQPKILLTATDTLSGVEFYQIKIDGGNTIAIPAEAAGTASYVLPLQNPGEHYLFAQVFDRAGNYNSLTDKFIITSVQPPVFTKYPFVMSTEGILAAEGRTYRNGNLIIWLQKGNNSPQSFAVKGDQDGNFAFSYDKKLASGIYQLWAEAVNERGAKSNPSERITILVEQPLISKIISLAMSTLGAVILFLVLIILLVIQFWYLFRGRRRPATAKDQEKYRDKK